MPYALDPTGDALQNLVIGEAMTFSVAVNNPYSILSPLSGPFFADTIHIQHTTTGGVKRVLQLNVDYKVGHIYKAATDQCNRLICGSFYLMDLTLTGTVTYTLQTLGGTYAITQTIATAIRNGEQRDPEVTTWEQVLTARSVALAAFPAVTHPYLKTVSSDYQAMVNALSDAGLAVHLRPAFLPTPDQVAFIPTKAEVGLGNVNNYGTATVQQAAAGTASNLYVTPQGAAAAASAVVSTQLASQGYKTSINYVATLSVTDPLQMYLFNGDLYIPRPSALPFTTSGVFETTKFMLVNSNSRDLWTETVINVVGNEAFDASNNRVLTHGRNFISGVKSRAVLNDLIELVEGVDYALGKNKMLMMRPVGANDVIVLNTKPMKSRVADTPPYYFTFTVTNTSVRTYTIDPIDNMDQTDLRVILNDLLTMSRVKGDYTISGTTLSIPTYPIALGDVIEIVSMDATPEIGRMQLRNLLTV